MLSADQRRETLLDIAKRLLNEGGPEAVTMGTVADQASVTRTTVYKHFENRTALLAELYRREAAALDRAIRRSVEAAPDGFEPKLRAFVGACLSAVGEQRAFFTPLRSAAGSNRSARTQQRRWDRRTSGYFAALAASEFALDEASAATAIGVLFTGITSLLGQMGRNPSAAERVRLENAYVAMTLGALAGLANPERTA